MDEHKLVAEYSCFQVLDENGFSLRPEDRMQVHDLRIACLEERINEVNSVDRLAAPDGTVANQQHP